ncbi:type 11 methyltransferase [Flammeovirgaceae bacterium 311]|nr:type 11 methyltransferase [Flammeovirgaceae bacterium 311]
MDLKEVHEQIHTTGISRRHPWELARLEVVYALSATYLHKPEGGGVQVLDIGCGDLFFCSNLAKKVKGAAIIAVDTALDQEELLALNKQYSRDNIRVFQNLEDVTGSLQEAEVIFLLDVLEHIPDDAAFLEKLRLYPFITENTVLVITTPAFQSLFSSHDVFLDHYRRYSSESLSRVLKKSGFRILKNGYFFFSLLPVRLLQTVWEKLRPGAAQRSETDAAAWKGGLLSTRLFQNMLLLDYKISALLGRAGIRIAGLSTYAICKRSAL